MKHGRRVKTRSIRTTSRHLTADANRKLKLVYWKEGVRACEFCGWRPAPAILGFMACLRLHHIVPLFCGGPLRDKENTALLCPNHATMGDAIALQSIDAAGGFKGPKSREQLFEKLREIEGQTIYIHTMAPKAMEGFNADYA